MQDFDLKQLEPFFFVALGMAALFFAALKKGRASALKDTGEKVEGNIYDIEQGFGSRTGFDSSVSKSDKITVRFVTKKGEWVTSELKQPFALFFTGQYKPGDKIDVYYDPINPSAFYTDTRQSELINRVLIAFVGIIFCLIGLAKFRS